MIEDNDEIRMRIVPIVLLRPLSLDIINLVFGKLLAKLPESDKQAVEKFIVRPEVKLRFIQYYLSFKLGELFINEVNDVAD